MPGDVAWLGGAVKGRRGYAGMFGGTGMERRAAARRRLERSGSRPSRTAGSAGCRCCSGLGIAAYFALPVEPALAARAGPWPSCSPGAWRAVAARRSRLLLGAALLAAACGFAARQAAHRLGRGAGARAADRPRRGARLGRAGRAAASGRSAADAPCRRRSNGCAPEERPRAGARLAWRDAAPER